MVFIRCTYRAVIFQSANMVNSLLSIAPTSLLWSCFFFHAVHHSTCAAEQCLLLGLISHPDHFQVGILWWYEVPVTLSCQHGRSPRFHCFCLWHVISRSRQVSGWADQNADVTQWGNFKFWMHLHKTMCGLPPWKDTVLSFLLFFLAFEYACFLCITPKSRNLQNGPLFAYMLQQEHSESAKSTQRVQTSAKANLLRIRTPESGYGSGLQIRTWIWVTSNI